MTKKKDKQTIGDIFFGKAGEVLTNARLYFRFKKIVKIIGKERKAVEDARTKIAKLYGSEKGETGEIRESGEMKKIEKGNQGDLVDEKKSASSADISPEGKMIFVPLAEVAKNSTYSKNYINFSARQGKLKAKKIKGVWHTTEEWLAEFTESSLAKKNKTKEKLSHDLGGNKKFVPEVIENAENGSLTSPMEVKLPRRIAKEEEIGSFPTLKAELEREMLEKQKAREDLKKNLKKAVVPRTVIFRARKSLTKNWNSAKTWIRELVEMNDAKEIAKLRKAKLADFWKLDFAKPAAAIIALVLLMAIGNITKADLASLGDQGKKQIYFAYNSGVDAAAKVAGSVNESAGKQMAKVKIGKEKFVKIAQDVLRREKITDFEKNSGLSLKGAENAKGEVAGVESDNEAASAAQSDATASQRGRVLAAVTTAAGIIQMNIGDIEVSAYLMDGENKELPNGEYEVRFGIYTTDRTESDPYPSDTDKGTRVWEETQKVIVENGLLKTYLGAVTPIPASFNFAASNYYIGIRVAQDAEMTPRKRIGAVPLARTAMNALTINGLTIGNAAGNVPTSNGTLNTNLNADLLDGQHSTAFQVAGSYQPAGTYDNYVAWKLQSAATDAGQKVKANKGAIFAGGNGIITSRLLNTLTISFDPTYSPTFADITATTINATTIDLGTNTITDQNFTGDWNFNAGNLTNITALTTNTANVTTLDLGTNTITDGNMTGNWNFNNGDLTNINAITAVTGNFTTANITTIDLGTNTITDQNFTGDWNFNGGDLSGVGDILPAANLTYNLGSPALQWNNVFTGTLDLGTNTITDQNMTGDWNFNAGNLTNITALTATTGNFTTVDLGTNTITDGNFNGDWSFNAGTLSSIASATVTGNFNLTASTNLIFGSVTSLGETTSPTDSGAYLVGANDEFANSASTNVQGVLNDLDAAIAGGGPGAMWTLSGGNIYPTNLANNVGIGTSTPSQIFQVNNSATAAFVITSAGQVGIGTTGPLSKLSINGGLHVGGDSDAGDNNLLVDGTTTSTGLLTASSGLTLTTGALNLTATSGVLTISGLSESSISTGAANILFTSGNFNTTATGINSTAIGATTTSTGAFTTLSSSGITNLATAGASAVNIATTGTGATTIGNATGTFQLISNGGLNVTTGGALTGVASIDTINVSSTALTFTGTAPTISVSTAATAINLEAGTTGEINIGSVSSGNVNIAAEGTGDILLAGGSSSTGCTVANATGNFTCSGNITGNPAGTVGFWTRTALNILPATSGDDLYLPSTSLLGVGYDPATIAGGVAAFNGNVGIGTTGPTYNLQVAGTLGIGGTAYFGGNVGIGTTNPLYNLEVIGTGRFSSTLTASSGLTLTTGALNLTATSGVLTISGLSESSISTGAANILFTSGNFNTTATGINSTAIGATTTSTGAFTTLSSSGITNLATAGASAVNIATTGTGATTIGNATGTFQLISNGGLNVSTGGALTGVASLDTINTSSTALTFTGTAPTISVSTAATAINLEAGTTGEINIGSVSSGNVNIAAEGTGDIVLAGGSLSTGCTIDNATGNLDCSGNITGSSSGTVGFWTRTALNLLPATTGDDLYLPTNSLLGVGYDPATLFAGTSAAFSGNVGIGTTSPSQKLHVVGNILFGAVDTALMSTYKGASSDGYNIWIGGGGQSSVGQAGTTVKGSRNSALGASALYSNTSGYRNTAIGMEALYFNTTGVTNTAIGMWALRANTAGWGNSVMGAYALGDLNITATDGTGYNVAIGYNTGRGILTGINNTIIGSNVTGLAAALSNTVIIADGAGNQRIYVDSTGYVGIGTTNPLAALSVGTTSQFQVDSSGNIVKLNNVTTSFPSSQGVTGSVLTNSDGAGTLTWASPSGTGIIGYWSRTGTNLSPATAGDDIYLGANELLGVGYDPATLFAGTSAAFSGNVGIGTTSPGAPLDFASSVGDKIKLYNGTNYGIGIQTNLMQIYTHSATTRLGLGYGNSGAFTETLTLKGGHVGIGTTNPEYSLAVETSTADDQAVRVMHRATTGTNYALVGAAIGVGATQNTGLYGLASGATTNYGLWIDGGNARIDSAVAIAYTDPGTAALAVNGNVGIGTTNPLQLLEVGSSSVGTQRIHLINTNAGTGAYAELSVKNGLTDGDGLRLQTVGTGFTTTGAFYQDGAVVSSGLNLSGGLSIGASHASGVMRFYTGGTADANERMRITSGGNVGIGTTNPLQLLEVGSSSVGTQRIHLINTNAGTGAYAELSVKNGLTDGDGLRLQTVGTGFTTTGAFYQDGAVVSSGLNLSGGLSIGASHASGVMRFYTGGTADANERMRITSGGNVGIGTTNPLAALEIGGSGNLRIGGLTASSGVYTDADKQLTSTPPATGVIGYWSKTGTNLSPATAGDDIYLGANELLGVGYDPATFLAGTSAAFSGNVGIGTTNPLKALDVVGTIRSTTGFATTASSNMSFVIPTDGYEFVFTNTAGGEYARIGYLGNFTLGTGGVVGTSATKVIGIGSGTAPTTSPADMVQLSARDWNGAGTSALFLRTEEGTQHVFGSNVGIGTTNPGAKLEVVAANGAPAISAYTDNVGRGIRVFTSDYVTSSVGTVMTLEMASGTGDVTGIINVNKTGGTVSGNLGLMIGTGNVGIGTTNPMQKVDIAGGSLEMDNNNGVMWRSAAGANGYWQLYPDASNKLQLIGNAGYRMTIDNLGNVGIGTTSPGAKLQVDTTATAGISQALILRNPQNWSAGVGVGFNAILGNTSLGKINFTINGAGATGIDFYNHQGNANPDLTIFNGNVGIGTTSPGAKLQVDTTATAGISQALILRNPQNWSAGVGVGFNAILGNTSLGKINFTINGAGATGIDFYNHQGNANPDLTIFNGNVGIGTTSPNQKLEVNGRIRMNTWTADGNVAVYYNSATGDIGVTSSDVRLKKNIQTIPDPMAIIQGITGVTYNMKTDSSGARKTVGVIAQDVAAAMPELTFPITGPDGEEYLSVHYDKLAPVLIEGIKQQQTQIADVNLKTSQNVETVGQLQKSVDENLTVISSNFSAVDTKLVLHDSELASSSAEEAGQNAKIADINSRLTSLDTQTSVITAQVSALNGNMSLNEAEKADLVSRLAAAEASLLESEHDLITFEKGTNDTLSSMLDTEDMLTAEVIDHRDRIAALEAKLAAMTVSTDGAAVTIPANVITMDASGNAVLKGIFEAEEVVAGAYSVKNETGTDAPTMGDSEIVSVKVDADQDGWDDATKVDGKSARVKTGAVTATAKIFVSFEGDPGARYWVEKITDADGELTDSFSVNVSEAVKKDVKFSWWIVEEK